MDVHGVAEEPVSVGGPAETGPASGVGVEAGPGVAPLGLAPPEPSGDPEVDRAVARLTQVDVLPTDRHGEVYEDVHRELREVLAGLDR